MSELISMALSLVSFCLFQPFETQITWSWSNFKRHPDNWIRFQFPFWWINIVSALDSISLMGFPKEDPDIKNALKWLIDHQISDGLWKVSYSKIHKSPDDKRTYKTRLWLTLTICRIFKRFYEKTDRVFLRFLLNQKLHIIRTLVLKDPFSSVFTSALKTKPFIELQSSIII